MPAAHPQHDHQPIVHRMTQHRRPDTSGFFCKVSEINAKCEGERTLQRVHVHDAEAGGGDPDGGPSAPTLDEAGLHVAAEQKFFRESQRQRQR